MSFYRPPSVSINLKCNSASSALCQLYHTSLNKRGKHLKSVKRHACKNAINNCRSYRKSVMFIINAEQLQSTKTVGSMFLIK